MATKWKSWTWNPVVKCVAFLVMLTCIYAELYLVLDEFSKRQSSLSYYDSWYDTLTLEEYAEQTLQNGLYLAARVAQYGSRERISRGNHLSWISDTAFENAITGDVHQVEGFYVVEAEWAGDWASESGGSVIYQVEPDAYDRVAELKDEVIRQQLMDFEDLLYSLDRSDLDYHIETGSVSLGGEPSGKYKLTYENGAAETNFVQNYFYNLSGALYEYQQMLPGSTVISLSTNGDRYLQYHSEMVEVRSRMHGFVQKTLGVFLLGLTALFVLATGIGRIRADGGKDIHFVLWDRIYLDVALGLYLVLFVVLFQLAESFGRFYGVQPRLQEYRLLLTGFLLVPFALGLVWFLSFLKRFKEGGWWRHTFVYHALHLALRLLRQAVESVSLWNNRIKLMCGAVIIVVLFFLSYAWDGFFLFAIVGALAVLWFHYHNLDLLQRSVQAVEEGHYNQPMGVKGGSYLALAKSLGSISQGMDDAVRRQTRSERMKTELITNVSHDLRTPLTSLITYTDLLKKEGLDSENAPEYLDILIQKTGRLKDLTDDLFEAAKAASGSITAHCEALDMSQLVRQCLGELDEQIEGSGLDFRVSLPDHAPVYADGRLVGRMVENLLSNVFKYAMEHSRVYIDVTEEDGLCRLDIKNISQNPLNNITVEELTERFKRGDESRHTEGSGLGLSIVQSFANAQGGELRLRVDGDLFKASIFLPATWQ